MIGRNRVLTHCVKILIRPSLIALLIKENSESYIVLFKISADWAGILYRDKVICFRFVRRYSITCILILFMTNIKIRMYDNTWFSSLLYMTWCSRLVYRLGKHTLAKIKIDKYFADIDDLIICQSKTETVRNVDSQNEIADLNGIKVHYNHSTSNLRNTRSNGF